MKKKDHRHRVSAVETGSIAEELGIEPGDLLLAVNDQEIEDIFDYHYLINEEYLTVLIEKPDGEQWELSIRLTGGRQRNYHGSNAYPPYWEALIKQFKPFIK